MNEPFLSPGEGDSSRLRLSVRGLSKSYAAVEQPDSPRAEAKGRIEVLRGLSFDLLEGGSLAVVGVSGVGKSTLLYQLGALDAPDEGEILFHGPVLRSPANGGAEGGWAGTRKAGVVPMRASGRAAAECALRASPPEGGQGFFDA